MFLNNDAVFSIPKCVDCDMNLSKEALKVIFPVYAQFIESQLRFIL